jgi:hypothetical protein
MRVKVPFTVLDDKTRALFMQAIAELGSKQAVANRIGVSRTAISLCLADKYAAGVHEVKRKFYEALALPVACPHLSKQITMKQCEGFRSRPFTTASRAVALHCMACRECPLNPAYIEKGLPSFQERLAA